MTTKTIHIDDSNKYAQAFLDYLKSLDFVKIEEDDVSIPQWQQDIVRERIKNTKKEDYVSWDEVEKNIKFD
jgi:hypothetical protein